MRRTNVSTRRKAAEGLTASKGYVGNPRKNKTTSPLSMFFLFFILPIIFVGFLLNDLILTPNNPEQQTSSLRSTPQELSKQAAAEVDLTNLSGTVVTAFFTVKSKYSTEDLHEWLSRLLSINDSMVIFTSYDMAEFVEDNRQHADDRTTIVPMELKDLPLAKKYSLSDWEAQHQKDPDKRHASYEEYWVWLSKTYFLQKALDLNPVQGSSFMFADVGAFKAKADNWWEEKVMMQHPEVIPPDRMLFMAHNDPNPSPSVWWTDKQKEKDYSYHSNALIAGNKESIPKFHEAFERVVQGFMDRNLFIGADDLIAQSVCLQHPDLCAYVPKIKGDNPFFALRSVLYRGGDYTLWTPPSK
jgi:hypothetical protein